MHNTPVTNIVIDEEFKALNGYLTKAEYATLESLIAQDGCRDAIVLWGSTIVDGHNRYEICMAHGFPYKTISVEFTDRDDAARWIYDNQNGRRNWNDFTRGEAKAKLKPILTLKAKQNLVTSTGGINARPLTNLSKAEPMNVRKHLAEASGVSEGQFAKIQFLAEKAPEPVKEKLRAGDTTIHAEYTKIVREQKQKLKSDATTSAIEASVAIPPTATIYNDNAILQMERMAKNGFLADLIATDPPYGQDAADWDEFKSEEAYESFAKAWITRAASCLRPGGSLYVFGTFRSLCPTMRWAQVAGLEFRTEIVWDYLNGAGGLWSRRHDLILYFTKPGGEPTFNKSAVQLERHEDHIREYRGVEYTAKSPGTVWRFPTVDGSSSERVDHPTQKPLELMRRIIRASSNPGEIVLDPFAGSGTTLLAAIQEGRLAFGIEQDERYAKLCHARTVLAGK